jgi:uncharacterized membrane protein
MSDANTATLATTPPASDPPASDPPTPDPPTPASASDPPTSANDALRKLKANVTANTRSSVTLEENLFDEALEKAKNIGVEFAQAKYETTKAHERAAMLAFLVSLVCSLLCLVLPKLVSDVSTPVTMLAAASGIFIAIAINLWPGFQRVTTTTRPVLGLVGLLVGFACFLVLR